LRRGSSAATAIVVLAAVSAWYKGAYLLFVGHGVPSRGGNQSSERHEKKGRIPRPNNCGIQGLKLIAV